MNLGAGPVLGATHVATTPEIGRSGPVVQQHDVPALPHGFPAKLDTKLAWVGQDFDDPLAYVYHLTAADLAEIARAIAHFKGVNPVLKVFFPEAHTGKLTVGQDLELDGEHVSRETFPLPQLGPKLDELSHEVHEGRGFCLVRGLRPEEYSVEDLTLVYLGVQTRIADQRGRQDSRGNMLGKLERRLRMRFRHADSWQCTSSPTRARRRAASTTGTRASRL